MKKLKHLGVAAVGAAVLILISIVPLPSATEDTSQASLIDKETAYEKEKAEYIQTYILDKILGTGKAIVMVDVQLGLETKIIKQEAKERKAERKKRLGEVDYLLPGVPNPKSVASESAPGESKEESGQAQETKIEVRTVIKKQMVTVLYDEKIGQEKLDIVKDAIITSLKIDTKRGDTLDFKKTKFTQGFFDELLRPQVLIPVIIALLLLFFLFGPFASFLRSYVRTLRERGGTEVTVDSKFEGGPGEGEEGKGGMGGAGALSAAELEALEREGKKYHPFDYINDDNIKRMVYLIRKEPPQTIALVVSYLKPEYVKEVINALTPEVQAKVALEMATIRSLSQEDVKKVDDYIKEKIEFLVGGVNHLLEVLDQVDKVTQMNIFDYLRDENPDLYEKVRKYVLMFEDIPNFPDQAMQLIIRELKTQDMAKALRNAPNEVLNKFFSNMSANAAAILREEMEYGRPLSNEEIEEERKRIMNLIKQMESEGKVFVRERPKTDVLEGYDGDTQGTAGQGEEGADYNTYFNAGVEYYDGGDYENALSYFEYCVQVNPYHPEVYQYIGNTYYALGRIREAVPYFEKALELNPGNSELKEWLNEQKKTIS
ncbi:MAG: tetratricopeptide repeat protein [Endomicrobiales bacterium]|nr:tetratricopeptide repeat protein [Endomicrobiales bacterium]